MQPSPLMRTKAIVLAVAAVLLAGLLTACGSSGGSGGKSLNVWIRGSGDAPKAFQALFDAYTKQSGVKVTMFSTLTDFETKLNAAAAAHKLPDVVVDDAAQLGAFRSQGIIQQVDRSSITGQGDLTDAAWNSVKDLSGDYYGVPFSAQADLLFVRKDWLAKVGMQPPTTWDQMVTVAKAFTTKDPDGDGKADTYGIAIPGSTKRGYLSWNWSTYLWQAGGEYFAKKGDKSFTSTINSPQAVQAAQWYEDLFCKDKVVQPSALNDATTDSNTAFWTGVAGMYLTGPYAFATSDKAQVNGKYVVVPAPRGPANDSVLAEGTTIYLMAGSKHVDQAKQLASFMITPQAQKIGMTAVPSSTIVRLPVNKKVDPAATYKNDPRWTTALQVFEKSAHYEPDYMPNWQTYRQDTSDALSKLLAGCGDPKSALDALNTKFEDVLKQQGVLASG